MSLRGRPEALAIAAQEAAVWCLRLSEGPLGPGDQQAFEQWLSVDPRNRTTLDEAVRTWREFEGAESAPEFLLLRVKALQAARRRGRPGLFGQVSSRRLAVAAGLALLVGAGALGSRLLTAPKIYQTGVGERELVRLADGSKVSLDAATRVQVRYTRDRRELELARGRARFEVAKDPLRPFSVAAADKVVVATGTAFSVELVQREVRVVLYEGRVAVLAKQDARDPTPRPVRVITRNTPDDGALTPGRELVAAVGTPRAYVNASDASRTLAWEAGQLVFVDEPLAAALERVNRYSDEKLSVGDQGTAGVLVSGVFTAGDTQAFVEGVTAAFPLRSRPGNNGRVLEMRPDG